MLNQSMSGAKADELIKGQLQQYAILIRDEVWSLEHAHKVLREGNLNLFQIAALAKVIACFECEA